MSIKAVIGGAIYGWHNIGDDGLLRGIIDDLNGFEIGVITKESEWLNAEFPSIKQFPLTQYEKPKYGCWLGNRKKLSTWINSLFPNRLPYKWSDVLICGGGTIFSACPWHAYRLTKLEEKENHKTVIWGAGMCEETDHERVNLIKKWCELDSVLHVYVRDELVENRLKRIGVNPQKISVCYDPAYILSPYNFELDDLKNEKAKKMLLSKNKKIVLTISGEGDIYNAIDLDFFKRLVSTLNEKCIEVFLIPISYSSHTKDRYIAEELNNNESSHICFIEEEFHPQKLIGFLQGINLCISSRLHMSIYSAIAGTPFISLKRNEKNSDLAELFNMPCFGFDELDLDSVLSDIYDLMEKGEQTRKLLLNQVEMYKKTHIEKAKEMKCLIEGACNR